MIEMEPGRNSLAEEQTEARYRSNLVRVRVRARARTGRGAPQTSAPRLHPGCIQAAPRLHPGCSPVRYRSLYDELSPLSAHAPLSIPPGALPITLRGAAQPVCSLPQEGAPGVIDSGAVAAGVDSGFAAFHKKERQG